MSEDREEPSPLTVPQGIPAIEAAAHAPQVERSQVVVITGMSGAGRTRAAAELEDLGWYVVDNLPPQMLVHLLELANHTGGTIRRFAAVLDVRGRQFFDDLHGVMEQMRAGEVDYRVLFLDASDEVLVRRYEHVRRPHPLQGEGRLLDGIAAERELLGRIRDQADVVIDTSALTVHDLGREVRAAVVTGHEEGLRINVLSFGFKYGLPLDADMVLDMRFVPNPYWVTELRHLTGRDAPVRDYVLGQQRTQEFLDRYVLALEPVLEGFMAEEKRFVTIAVGCTGGKHRSVATSEELGRRLRALGHRVVVTARDLGKE
ncbi:MAG: RNase adapter RapZ [Cellulomonadaceae bacterium]